MINNVHPVIHSWGSIQINNACKLTYKHSLPKKKKKGKINVNGCLNDISL